MTGFTFLGGWTVGREVIETLAEDLVVGTISLDQGVALLFFIGAGILISNLQSVPVPSSIRRPSRGTFRCGSSALPWPSFSRTPTFP